MEDYYEQLSLFEEDMIEKKITKPVRLISFFSGIEAQFKALSYLEKVLQIPVESYKTCEWAYNSIIACNAIHNRDFTNYSEGKTKEEMIERIRGISVNYNEPLSDEQLNKKPLKWIQNAYNNCVANHNLINIMNVHASDLEIIDNSKHEYIVTYSYPCIVGDNLILTLEKGYIRFDLVEIGMHVLSRDGKWHEVTKFFDNGIHETCHINAQCFHDIHCTPNHKFWVRKMKRVGHLNKRTFSNPEWIHAEDLDKTCYLGMKVIEDEIPFHSNSLAFWKLIGMYVGDGWISKNNGDVKIACNEKKLETVKRLLDELEINYTVNQNSTHCWNVRTSNKQLREFITNYIGTGSYDKRISTEILTLPKTQLQQFFDGYLEADGCVINGKYQFSTVNRNIAYSMCAIVNKLFHRPCSMYLIKAPNKHVIQGREVNQSDWYQLRFKPINNKQDKAFYENGWIWYPFKSRKNASQEHVYDIEVETDHAFMLQGCAISNCQDLSLAGKRAGMAVSQAEGGTRSGLLWEVERIIMECRELGYKHMPNILVMENVPQVHSKKDLPHFSKWINRLFELGYSNYYIDLNATDYGIPQNRERCFMVSILNSPEGKEHIFRFPAPIGRKISLKDFLEDKVDEKYYLSQAMIEYLTGINQVESKYNRTEVFMRNLDPNKDVACTITTAAGQRATDNFVIEGDLSKIDYIPIRNATKKGYLEAHDGDGVNIGGRMKYQRGNVQPGMCQTLKTSIDVGVCLFEGYDENIRQVPNLNGFRIRKLTPKETNRLMAFTDEDYQHMRDIGMTDSQIFHVNGDSIVVTIMIGIFAKLFGLSNKEIENVINDYVETIKNS